MEYSEYVQLRDLANLTDYKVAKLAGIGRSTFSDWKNGRSKPKDEKIGKILAVLYDAGAVPPYNKTKADMLFKKIDIDIIPENEPYRTGYEKAQDNMRFIAKYEKIVPRDKVPEEAASQPALSDETMNKLKALDDDQIDLIKSMIDKMYETKKK